MTTEIEQMRSKLFQVTYENERKDATIKSLHDAAFTRTVQQVPLIQKDTEGGAALENLNEQLIQCLEELCAKEQFIEAAEGQLRYAAQFQTLTDQQHVLYEEHLRNNAEYQRQLSALEKQLLTAKTQEIEAEEYSRALGDGSEDTLKGRIAELTRRVVLLRADSETIQRKYSYLVLEYETKLKEADKSKAEGIEMERTLQEHILFVELANTRFSAKLEAQQAILDKSVPAADFEILSRKYALLTKQHEEALAKEKVAIDYRIATEPREQELVKLTARVQELEVSVDAANQRAARFEEILHTDARYIASAAGSSIRIASLEAELVNAEKQTQLARSRERATNETHRELEDRIQKLETQVVDQVKRIHQLTVLETELRNQLVGTITREEASQLEAQTATLKEEVSRVGVDLIKNKELASIATAQSVSIVANAESSANELSQLRAAVRDLQAKGDQEHLLGELYQRVTVLQMSEASAQHKAQHYRTEFQRLSLTHRKLMQRVDEFLNKYFTHKEQHRSIIHEYHKRMDDTGALVGQRWLDKLMQIMDAYRSAETRITELLKNNRTLRDRRTDADEKIPSLETQLHELQSLVDTLRRGSPEADRVAEWGTQAVTGKLELLALQRRIMGLQEHEAYLARVQTALEATIRRMEEQSIKEEFVWEQKARAQHAQARELERRLLEKEHADDAAMKSEFEQAKATEPPSTSLPLNERLESALRQLEEAQKIISAQNASILTLNTNTLALNAKFRAQEDLVLDKESQIHELNVRMARAAVAEAGSLIATSNAAVGVYPIIPPTTSTTELRSLQTMYQFACNTIEGLRDMVASKEDSVLRYQQMIVQARETHRRDRQNLEAEIRIIYSNKLADRIAVHEGDMVLKEIMEDLKRAEQAPRAPASSEPVVPSYEVDAMLHTKQHEIREIASQLDVARIDAATATLQLDSAVKQRDHWRAKYETDMDDVRTRHAKERELETTIEIAEKDNLRKENTRLQKELSMQQHEVVKLKNELTAEIARAQLLDQEKLVSVTQMRDQLNLKEKKLQTLQGAIAMLKQELVAASQTMAEKSIRETREEFDKDTRNKDNKNKGDNSFITDEQVEPLIRRIEGLQEVVTRMKADQATLSKAEGQLRSQIASLHRERTNLASEAAKHESTSRSASEDLRRCQLQLQDARDTIATLEKKIAAAMRPSSIPKPPASAAGEAKGATDSSDQPKRSQTQLLRARSKNNNPPTRPTLSQPPKPAAKSTKPPSQPKQPPASKSQDSSDESDYSLDFDDDISEQTIRDNKDNKVNDNLNQNKAPETARSSSAQQNKVSEPTKEPSTQQVEKYSDIFDEESEDEDETNLEDKVDNAGKTKDNKTLLQGPKQVHKSKQTPRTEPTTSIPPPSKLPARERNPNMPPPEPSARKDTKDAPPKDASLSKDNKNPQIKNDTEDEAEKLRKMQVMAKWEGEKKSQKQIEALKKRISTLSAELTTSTQQVTSLKEMLARTQTEKSTLENLYNTLKTKQEKEAHQFSSLSPSVEHVMQLKSQISNLEDEVSRLDRIAHVEKDQQIATLTHENTGLKERVNVLELLITACRDDMGTKIPHQTKEMTIMVPKLQAEAQANAGVVLEKDNQIIELRFDKEELRRTVLRLQTRITDLELLSQIGGTGNATGPATANKSRDTELQGVITALRNVAERLKTENENLKKNAIPNTKYMEVVKENKILKQKLAETTNSTNTRAGKDEVAAAAVSAPPTSVSALTTENDQLKKRLKREIENNQKYLKIIEDHEATARNFIENTKKLTQVQRNLEAALATAQETIRKKEADLKSLLLALEDAKANSDHDDKPSAVERLELQLEQKEDDYLLLLNKLEDMENRNKELQTDLNAFDEAFFVEIEELKNNYQKALELIAQYESQLAAT